MRLLKQTFKTWQQLSRHPCSDSAMNTQSGPNGPHHPFPPQSWMLSRLSHSQGHPAANFSCSHRDTSPSTLQVCEGLHTPDPGVRCKFICHVNCLLLKSTHQYSKPENNPTPSEETERVHLQVHSRGKIHSEEAPVHRLFSEPLRNTHFVFIPEMYNLRACTRHN